MASTHEIIAAMRQAAPPGQRELDYATREQLRVYTDLLIDSDRTAAGEYDRFVGVRDREIDLSSVTDALDSAYRGRRVLVTGGTGCIGARLLGLLARYDPAGLFVVSRGTREFTPVPGVVYLPCDVADTGRLTEIMTEVRPDVVFHLAAQRDPGLAERAVVETVRTNVVGTRSLLRACRAAEVPRLVHASTGKAMRYYTSDIYASSKKLAEWLVHEYAAEGRVAGAARFTHVVDNGVILGKIEEAMRDPHGVVRIHDPEIAFYVQSAIESAQLLLVAGLSPAAGRLHLVAIRELGEPACLLPMTLGKIAGRPAPPPIYFSGYDPGYEKGTPPGLYDPFTATDLSPLINAVEAGTAGVVDDVPAVDRFGLTLPGHHRGIEQVIDRLDAECGRHPGGAAPLLLAAALARAGRTMAEAAFGECPEPLFVRLHRMASQAGVRLPTPRMPVGVLSQRAR